ncbi:MAG: glycosyltransferase family 4 protein, partial [Candidatus Portiera sp.]|nr:glycosyltransferase family 4 protein [Portiera sp.]
TGELAEFLSPPGDTEAMAKNIRKVIDHPPRLGYEHIAKFHKDVNFQKYLSLVEGNK